MKSTNDNSVSRRSFVTLAAIGGASLLVPSIALADTGADKGLNAGEMTGEIIFDYPDMTPAEFEAMLRKQAEKEAAEIIAQAEAERTPPAPQRALVLAMRRFTSRLVTCRAAIATSLVSLLAGLTSSRAATFT